jgi:aldose 1-epimerase
VVNPQSQFPPSPNFSKIKKPLGAIPMKTETTSIGSKPIVILERTRSTDQTRPQLLEAILLPGRGMSLLQIKAYLPGAGEIGLINSPPITDAKRILDQEDDEWGNQVFHLGGAILLPYPNRITGKLSHDGKKIQTTVAGKSVFLPANWHGKNPGAPVVAMHGLLLRARFQDVHQHDGPNKSRVSADFHAGDFGGHWPSQTDVKVEAVLQDNRFEMHIESKNVGNELLPMSIAFHPAFIFPSAHRAQVKLHVPAAQRALVTNYDDVLPTGQIEDVKDTPYDFTAPGGKKLGAKFLDDTFTALQRQADGSAAVTITDPAANYGLRIVALEPAIRTFQVYAPPGKNYIAVEPQFNLVDPYNKIWGNRDTGMVSLQPGKSVSWRVRLEVFTPGE